MGIDRKKLGVVVNYPNLVGRVRELIVLHLNLFKVLASHPIAIIDAVAFVLVTFLVLTN